MKKNFLMAVATMTMLSLATPVTAQAAEVPNGLALAEDGNWYYFNNGSIDRTYTGLALNEYGWWYVKDGVIDVNYTGMASNEYGWWYVRDGVIDWNYTGMASNEYGWWYMTNGALDWAYTGLAENAYGWWYMNNGALDWTYNGMAENEYGWWKVTNGGVDFGFEGISENEYGYWYLNNGTVDFAFTGLWRNNDADPSYEETHWEDYSGHYEYYVVGGKAEKLLIEFNGYTNAKFMELGMPYGLYYCTNGGRFAYDELCTSVPLRGQPYITKVEVRSAN